MSEELTKILLSPYVLSGVGLFFAFLFFLFVVGVRYIPNDKIGIIEKMWSTKGSLDEGQIIALDGKAGYQSEILRGGVHLWYWRWQYCITKKSLVTIRQGKIGYVFSRDGKPLTPDQTLGKVVDCNNFQDARKFLNGGQRGRQRLILREGVYAINVALFNVITEEKIHAVTSDKENLQEWREALSKEKGFDPIVIGGRTDDIGIITIHDGPSLPAGELIAPDVGDDSNSHNNYQDPEKFLAAGGNRGRQYRPITDGTYFINRWFATCESRPKYCVTIGHVGVVVSYYGKHGQDTSGVSFRHGEQVNEGEKGVWRTPLQPGKYPFNDFAGTIIDVPTTNFVLHWIDNRSESHNYDDTLKSIDLITKDAYEPSLPLSVVVHIDYQKAPSVIQRFGDVKQLITQTLDPLLSAYFRDVAHQKTMLELIHDRDKIQKQSREELAVRFEKFDIQCVDVLIGKPASSSKDGKIEILLEQLRVRQLAEEQMQTFAKQEIAAAKQQTLNEAKAKADKQTDLTNSKIQIEIEQNQADAQLQRAKKEAEKTVVLANAQSQQSILTGKGEAASILQRGLAEANVLHEKVASYGDPRLYAMSIIAEYFTKSKQPLVPDKMIVMGGDGEGSTNFFSTFLGLLTAEKLGIEFKQREKSKEMTSVIAQIDEAITGRKKDSELTACVREASFDGIVHEDPPHFH